MCRSWRERSFLYGVATRISTETSTHSVEGPHAVDLRRRKHGGPCRAEQCPLDLPLPGLGPAPSGGLTANSRRTQAQAPRNVASILDSARELGIRDAHDSCNNAPHRRTGSLDTSRQRNGPVAGHVSGTYPLIPAYQDLAAGGEGPPSHRDERGALWTRRDDREYLLYLTEEQRGPRGCIARRMQTDFHHRLLGSPQSSVT